MPTKDELAAQMREAIDYLSKVKLPTTSLRIDACTIQRNPKRYFEEHTPIVRSLYGKKAFEMAVYHYIRFYHAVKDLNDGKPQLPIPEEKLVINAPVAKAITKPKPTKRK